MAKAAKLVRRTQEDRSASTRARLYEAAVNCLYTRGYAATTTMIVSEEAGVSRGAMLHQFPTKVDLMLYVVQAAYEEELQLYHQALDPIPDPRERRLAFPKLVWEILRRPAGVAVLEIMQGSRSDPELSARLKPLQREIEQDSFRQVEAVVGKSNQKSTAAVTRLVVWTIRGLSIARLLTDETEGIESSVNLFCRMLADHANAPAAARSAPTAKRTRKSS